MTTDSVTADQRGAIAALAESLQRPVFRLLSREPDDDDAVAEVDLGNGVSVTVCESAWAAAQLVASYAHEAQLALAADAVAHVDPDAEAERLRQRLAQTTADARDMWGSVAATLVVEDDPDVTTAIALPTTQLLQQREEPPIDDGQRSAVQLAFEKLPEDARMQLVADTQRYIARRAAALLRAQRRGEQQHDG